MFVAPGPKNYVFVDEHNRHKRLKVMRACEGCRRRKIKCDAASTNTWPCSACTRLKLHCVPPSMGNDRDYVGTGSFADSEDTVEYCVSPTHGVDALRQPPSSSHEYCTGPTAQPPSTTSSFDRSSFPYQWNSYPLPRGDLPQSFYSDEQELFPSSQPSSHDSTLYYPPAPIPQPSYNNTTLTADTDYSTAQNLSDALGELKIGEFGIASYLRQQKDHDVEPDGPILDPEVKLPAFNSTAGSHVRIPPALMPAAEDALCLFDIFFANVHPYVPVVVKSHFHQQWRKDKESISPLLLEAIFACSGRMSDDPAQGAQWLALANKQEEHFLDTPRLSTLQALLLLLKARESVPKRGYYYRSWMTCKTIVTMSKDLDLHEHYSAHTDGQCCDSDPVECLTKTRIWQTILICEMMVGSPQGRVDFGVDPDTVDIRPNPPCSDMNDFEASSSRRFAYFVRNARNIRLAVDAAHRAKKKKDWGLDANFVAFNENFKNWPLELPPDLRITLPEDGSPPFLPSHFIGNMHSHYRLGIVMLYRPQLAASKNFSTDAAWKHHMGLCYESAKILCRLQEAILQKFGLTGLLCMLRGINFTIYAILTCTMVHLIALVSPDPEFNRDAREYFTRHMRVLEQCISAWPMPEMEAQINTLRVAFSADVDKPFELKSSFPYGSPSGQYHPSLPLDDYDKGAQISSKPSYDNTTRYSQISHITPQAMTPTIETGLSDQKPLIAQYQGDPDTAQVHHNQTQSSLPTPQSDTTQGQSQWNPMPIIDQWNNAFSIPPSQMAPPSNHSSSPTSSLPPHAQPVPQLIPQTPYPQPYTQTNIVAPLFQQQTLISYHIPQHQLTHTMPQTQAPFVSDSPMFVTPRDWQQSVASVFDPGSLKRRWDCGTLQATDNLVVERMK